MNEAEYWEQQEKMRKTGWFVTILKFLFFSLPVIDLIYSIIWRWW
jgi:hypothetical protein